MRFILCIIVMAFIAPSTAFGTENLHIYIWTNYIPPSLIERFQNDTGINVDIDFYEANETILSNLNSKSTSYDIAVPSGYMVRTLIEKALVEKIDTWRMPNFLNVSPPHDKPPFDPQREYSAPYMWGTTGFAYDSARSPELKESWKEFFEPRHSLSGHVVAMNDPADMWNSASHYLGIDTCTEDIEDANQILDVLEQQKVQLAMYSSSGIIERMAAGEVIMHHMWNGAAHRAKIVRESITYVYPKEGLDVWGDHFVIPQGAPNVENAKTFINWMMDPKNAAEASNYTGYMNAIAGSGEYLDDSLKADPAVNMPEEYADRLRPLLDCSTTARELRDKVWTQLKK